MRSATVALASALVLSLSLTAPAYAQRGAADPGAVSAAEQEEADLAAWTKKLDEGRARIDTATRRVTELEQAKGRGLSQRYPRGEAKAKYLDDLHAAHQELDEATRAFPELLEEARRAGVPPGVLGRYEEPDES